MTESIVKIQQYEIPENARLIGSLNGEPIYLHGQVFIHGLSGRHDRVALSPEQAKLFGAIINKQGAYINQQELMHQYMEAVPGYEPDTLEINRVIQPAIHRLRAVLRLFDPSFAEALTMKRNVGYRFKFEEEHK